MSQRILFSQEAMQRMISRIAHEIIEREENLDNLVLVGIKTRGIYLAQRIQARLRAFTGKQVALEALDIAFYRDDLTHLTDEPTLTTIPNFTSDIDGKQVVVVDDVMYTGRTLRAAMEAIFDQGRPAAIRFACMVDRGHRELPFRADFIGKNVPTSRSEKIRVNVQEIDGCDNIAIESRLSVKESKEN